MANPAVNLETCAIALDLIQDAIGESSKYYSAISGTSSKILSEMQNVNAGIELLNEVMSDLSSKMSSLSQTLSEKITKDSETKSVPDSAKPESKDSVNVEAVIKPNDINRLITAIDNAASQISTVNTSVSGIVSGISTVDNTIKVAANGLYQQLARVNNNLVGVTQSLNVSSSASITNIESGVNQISVLTSSIDGTIHGISADMTYMLAALTNVHDRLQELFMISSILINIEANTNNSNTLLNLLISAVQNLNLSGSGTTINIVPIVSELQNISSLIKELDRTLVMVGNNIVAQIQMIPAAGGTITLSGIETRLDMVITLLDNVNNWLDTVNQTIIGGIDISDARSLGTQDILIKEMSNLLQGIQNNNNNNNNNRRQEYNGGRNASPNLRPFLDSLRGGIVTATMEGGKQLVNIFNAIKSTASSGGAMGLMGGAVSAFAALPGALGSIVDLASKFVSALDPAVMQQLQLAFSDLMAVVGIGLRPIIQAVIPIVRGFANALKPVMDALAPVMQELGNALIDIAIPYIYIWANALFSMIPVIESIIPLFVDFAEMLAESTPILTFVFDMLARTLNLLIGVFYTVLAALKNFAAVIIDIGAGLVSWFSKSKSEGMKGAADALRRSADKSAESAYKAFTRAVTPGKKLDLSRKEDTTGMAAKQASYSGIADLGKNVMQAAFGSSSQEAALNTANNTKRMADGMDTLVAKMGARPQPEQRMAGVRR